MYEACEARDTRPIIPLRQTPGVKRGDHNPPRCEHGEWRFARSDRGRAVFEREFGRLKNDWALSPLRVRGLDRVRLRADLTILAKLTSALARARAPLTVPLPTAA
jgi:hypothetical protein